MGAKMINLSKMWPTAVAVAEKEGHFSHMIRNTATRCLAQTKRYQQNQAVDKEGFRLVRKLWLSVEKDNVQLARATLNELEKHIG